MSFRGLRVAARQLRAQLPESVDRQVQILARIRGRDNRRWFREELEAYEAQDQGADRESGIAFPVDRNLFPIVRDRLSAAGVGGGHYFHADLFSAQSIFHNDPQRHVDVGSSVEGFVAHVASFRAIDVIDLRPLHSNARNIFFHQADLFELGPEWLESTDSLSCLSVLEHFGLGRYGDQVSYSAWIEGLDALKSMLKVGGRLYLSVPTGEPQRTEFNAHRVFSFPTLRDVLEEKFTIESVGFIDDRGDFSLVNAWGAEANSSYGATYGCSVWVLVKSDQT